ncbi:SERINE-THREONINE PROTEIN KINASE [Salix purpurea]|uniref:SERINE-THREONINE PROTEIN KINASE n=1 Tax=Salix purpurea TaxID=77065 RepID=A0A9Q0WX49_SALPP|nr:SERINE-THREONINE PROTEIN KINASE [Salix purpurea]
MEESEIYKQHQYNYGDPRDDISQPASQAYTSDPSSSRDSNTRIPDLHVRLPEVKPVRNYSIQTGEEFALEFMRDRVNPKKPHIPDAASDPNYVTGYLELKGILGISHTGSESGSDISMLTIVERGQKDSERMDSSLHEERSNYGSIQLVPRTSSSYGALHGYASSGAFNSLSGKMKVLCSFGGKILPRPSDGQLRYVGGEKRIMCVARDISWHEFKQKTLAIYNEARVIKYQLPGEDLDALVSVSCDEDLLNMMGEWSEVEDREGSQKLRLFLFSMSDLEDAQVGLGSVEGDSEVQYVVAVNGMDMGSRRGSTLHGLASSSGNNLDELDGSNIDREKINAASVSVGVSASPLTGTCQSSQLTLQSSSNAYDTYPHFYHDQMMDHRDTEHFPLHNHHHSSNYSPFGDIPYSRQLHGHMNEEARFYEQQCSSFQIKNSQQTGKEVKPKPSGSIQQKIDLGKTHASENIYPAPVDEVPVPAAVPEGDLSTIPSKYEGKRQEPKKVSSFVDDVNQMQVPRSHEDDQRSTPSGASGPGNADSALNPVDLSYLEPSIPPQRVYYSERRPRGQAELLKRLSKSDDSLGSQLVMSHSLSGVTESNPVMESVENLHESNLAAHTEHFISTAKPSCTDSQIVHDGAPQFQQPKEFSDAISQMNKKLPDSERVSDFGFKEAVAKNFDEIDSANKDRNLKEDSETDMVAGNHGKLPGDVKGEVGSGHLAVHQATCAVQHKDPTADLPDELDEMTTRDVTDEDNLGHFQPFSWTDSSTKVVVGGIPPVTVSATKQAEIQIDINDRFPRDFISEIFSKGIFTEETPGLSPLHNDGAGVSVNMENHEPKHWSYFHKLAKEDFVQKDVSLIDQDHLTTPAGLSNVDHKSYRFTHFAEGVDSVGHDYSQIIFDQDNQNNLPGMAGADSTMMSDFDDSQLKETESMQFEAMMENLQSPESQYEDGKPDNRNDGLPPRDPSLGDIDINTLQVIQNEDLEEQKELGSGTFGTVYHGKWRGTDVAIKRLKKNCFTGRSSEQERLTLEFWREADILSKLHHPNVVAFYGVVQDGHGVALATVTEYMVDGSLRNVLLRKDRFLDRRKRLLIAMDAAFGMEYLHSKNIVHFDLKCDNLLVNLKDPQRPICKVGDFGLSKIKRNTLVSGGVRGTLPWMAPELLNGSSNKVSEKVDVFSFGIVLWEILTGEDPYANMHYGAIIGGIVNNTLRPTIPSYCDSEWGILMEQCWAPNPAVRPSFTEIASRLRIMSAAASQGKGHGHKASK